MANIFLDTDFRYCAKYRFYLVEQILSPIRKQNIHANIAPVGISYQISNSYDSEAFHLCKTVDNFSPPVS